jgi:hypothetical protein
MQTITSALVNDFNFLKLRLMWTVWASFLPETARLGIKDLGYIEGRHRRSGTIQGNRKELLSRMKIFDADNGSEFLNWPLQEYQHGHRRK